MRQKQIAILLMVVMLIGCTSKEAKIAVELSDIASVGFLKDIDSIVKEPGDDKTQDATYPNLKANSGPAKIKKHIKDIDDLFYRFDSELRGPDVALATRGLVTNPESAATYDEHAKSGAEKAAEELNVLSARRVADLATTSLQQDIDYLNKMDALIYALHCNICGTDKAQATRKSIAPSLMIPTALAPPAPLTTQKAVSQPTADDPATKKEK